MKGRILVAAIFIPLLIFIILFGNLTFFIFMTGVIEFALYEFYKMIESKDLSTFKIRGLIIGLIIPVTYNFGIWDKIVDANLEYFIPTAVVIYFIIEQIIRGKIKEAIGEISFTLFGVFYISFLFSHIFFMKDLPKGKIWVLACFLLVWACDSAAYFIGIKFGRNKLSPKISPKKSIEGSVAGLFASVLAMILLKYVFKAIDVALIHIIVVGLLVGAFGQLGDLGESLFKREFEVKDSGNMLLGHGGVLDRFDSLIFVIPIVYYYVKIFVI